MPVRRPAPPTARPRLGAPRPPATTFFAERTHFAAWPALAEKRVGARRGVGRPLSKPLPQELGERLER